MLQRLNIEYANEYAMFIF